MLKEASSEALGLKLGHQRVFLVFAAAPTFTDYSKQKLQKEIAEARGVTIEQVIGANTRIISTDDLPHGDSDAKSITSQGDQRNTSGGQSKRKYRRHPKVRSLSHIQDCYSSGVELQQVQSDILRTIRLEYLSIKIADFLPFQAR